MSSKPIKLERRILGGSVTNILIFPTSSVLSQGIIDTNPFNDCQTFSFKSFYTLCTSCTEDQFLNILSYMYWHHGKPQFIANYRTDYDPDATQRIINFLKEKGCKIILNESYDSSRSTRMTIVYINFRQAMSSRSGTPSVADLNITIKDTNLSYNT